MVVWIYGGGFATGTATLDLYNPRKFVDLRQIIFVAIQYRLGPLGFMYLGEDSFAKGNAGLLDQVSRLAELLQNLTFVRLENLRSE